MMNKVEHLFACLGEECGEVQQVVGKTLRFGTDSSHPKTGDIPNIELLKNELGDIVAVYEMICRELHISSELDEEHKRQKKIKVEKYYERFCNSTKTQ